MKIIHKEMSATVYSQVPIHRSEWSTAVIEPGERHKQQAENLLNLKSRGQGEGRVHCPNCPPPTVFYTSSSCHAKDLLEFFIKSYTFFLTKTNTG